MKLSYVNTPLARSVSFSYHDSIEIQYIFSGKCTYFIRNKLYELEKNDLLIIHNNEPHCFVNSPKIEKLCLIISKDFLKNIENKQINLKPLLTCRKGFAHKVRFPDPAETELLVVLKQLIKEYEDIKSNRQPFSGRLVYLFSMILKYHSEKKTINKKPALNTSQQKYVKEALYFIDQNYTRDIDLNDLAKAVHITPTYFSHLFKKLTGNTFKDYLINKRISFAKEQIAKNPTEKIISAALFSGFSDLSNFNHVFKKLVGTTPSEYRKIHQ